MRIVFLIQLYKCKYTVVDLGGGGLLVRVHKRNSVSGKRAHVTSFRSMGFTKTPYERPLPIQFYGQAKFENDCISINGHIIKFAQPNSTILVSVSSAEDGLSKRCDTFSLQGSENPPFRFFGGHPVYTVFMKDNFCLLYY